MRYDYLRNGLQGGQADDDGNITLIYQEWFDAVALRVNMEHDLMINVNAMQYPI